MLNSNDIEQSYERIRPYIRKTPIIDLETGTFGSKASINLKVECLQHTGSFKSRGAFNRLLRLTLCNTKIVAASGGNHGIAVAYATKQLGIPAEIFVPSISSPVKQARIRALGATVHIAGKVYADALVASENHAQATGAINVRAYHHPDVIAGQGTVGLEWESQAPKLDTLLISVGGGGLIGGICAWYAGRVKIIAVEPEQAPTLYVSRTAGKPTDTEIDGIASDSLGARCISKLAFELTQSYLYDSILVSDRSICEAQRQLWSNLCIAAEPGGATALAALISGAYQPQAGERVGVLICGGNVDLSSFPV